MNQLINTDIKMTSLDIAEIVGKLHHHVMRDIRNEIESLGEELGATIFGLTSYKDKSNRDSPCYSFSKEGAMQLALKYDAKTRYKVIKKIEELENKKTEIDTTQLSPELQLMNQMVKAMAKNEFEAKEAKELALKATQSVNNISNIVTMSNVEWRDKVNVILKRIASNWTGIEPFRSVKNLSYERLEKRAGCNLNLRLNNRKERALAQGMSKTFIRNINKLDVISEEKRLVEIYIQVVKEMAIEFRVNINDFEEVI